MELRHLRYFIAIAEEKHMTRAAARLGIEQPPLSVQMKALEKELGFPLFTRHARGVDLTVGGEVLLEGARGILASVERTIQQAARAAQGFEGHVCVAFTTSVAAHSFAADVIRVYRQAYPDVALEVRENYVRQVIDMTYRGSVDVAMLRIPVSMPPGLIAEQLLDEQMVLVLPRNHKLLKGKPTDKEPRISLRQLAHEAFVMTRPNMSRAGTGMYPNLLRACERLGFSPRIATNVMPDGGMNSVVNLVAGGAGVSVVAESLRGTHSDAVVYCRLTDAPGLHAPITLAYLENNRNPAAANYIALARERAARFKKRRRR